MRQNGLRASSFVAVADVDPRIADQLLDLLAFAHVAAYAEPVPGHVGVYRDHHVPTRPIDRLWVDREATGPAREVLDRSLAHLHAELETAIAEGVLAGGPTTTDRRAQPVGHAPDGSGADSASHDVAGSSGAPAPDQTTGQPGAAPAADASLAAVAGGTVETPPSSPPTPGPPAPGPATPGSPAPGSPAPGAAMPGSPAPGDDPSAEAASTPGEPAGPDASPGTGPGGSTRSERPPATDLDQAAVDARWRDIVAGWDGPAADGGGSVTAAPTGRRGTAPTPPAHPLGFGTPWPATAPPAPQPGDRRRTDRGPIDPARRRENRVDGPAADPPGPRDHTPVPEDEHFSPPAPTAHPPLEKTTRLGWAGLVLGLVVLVVVVAVGSEMLPRWLPLLGVALLVGGFAALVSRLHRSTPDEDDHDPDDGAVV